MGTKLDAVVQSPDLPQILLEYAEQLREQGDPRADYAQLQYELRNSSTFTEPELAALRRIYPADLRWVNRLERCGAFCRNLCREDLASARFLPDFPRGSTKPNSIRFQSLAPFDTNQLNSQFSWLHTEPVKERCELTKADPTKMTGWESIVETLRHDGFLVPDSFSFLMVNTDLQAKLPSITDDYFLTADEIVAEDWLQLTKTNDSAIYLPFYADSQWGVVYGIRLSKNNERYCPIVTGYPDEKHWDEACPTELHGSRFTVGASSIESFIYQMWIYNRAWYASKSENHKRPLTDEESAYWNFAESNDWRRW